MRLRSSADCARRFDLKNYRRTEAGVDLVMKDQSHALHCGHQAYVPIHRGSNEAQIALAMRENRY
jgi:hypothetical protein